MYTHLGYLKVDERRPLLYADPSLLRNKDRSLSEQSTQVSRRQSAAKPEVATSCGCVKNSILIAVIFLLVYTGYASLSNLESSLSVIGVEALSVAGVSAVFGCYMSPLILGIIRPKTAIAMAWICMALFIAANFYPTQFTLFPACVMFGFAGGSAWTAQLSYTTNTAIMYAKLTGKAEADTIGVSNGVFFLAYASAQVFGNIISSLVLKSGGTPTPYLEQMSSLNTSTFENVTTVNTSLIDNGTWIATPFQEVTNLLTPGNSQVNNATCGLDYCPVANPSLTMETPPKTAVCTLLGIFLGCVGSGFLVCVIFLDPIDRFLTPSTRDDKPDCARTLLLSPLSHFKDPRMLVLIPVLLYTGVQQIIMFAQFTKAFVNCSVGVHYVGYVMTCWGLCCAVTSLLAGILSSYVGRATLCLTGLVSQLGLHGYLLLYTGDYDISSLFLMSAGWGLTDALLHTQLSALVGVMFRKNQDAAFAIFRMFSNMGFAITYGYSAHFCQRTDLYISAILLVVSILCYSTVEICNYVIRQPEVLDVRVVENSLTSSYRIYA